MEESKLRGAASVPLDLFSGMRFLVSESTGRSHAGGQTIDGDYDVYVQRCAGGDAELPAAD